MTLSLDHVTVRYGDTAAVDDVSLDLASGQVLAVLGPSGCGKSTLLRAVAGLEPLSAGRISWDGADLSGTPTHKRGFALMFQDGQLFAHLTVARNVARISPIELAASRQVRLQRLYPKAVWKQDLRQLVVPVPPKTDSTALFRSSCSIAGACLLIPDARIFEGPGRIANLVSSPDGAWIAAGWPAADQFLFFRRAPRIGKVRAVSNVTAEFLPGGGAASCPVIAGWAPPAP